MSDRLNEQIKHEKNKEMREAYSNASSMKENQPDKALEYYAKAIEKAKDVHPDYEGAYSFEASSLFFKLGRYEEAAKYAELQT